MQPDDASREAANLRLSNPISNKNGQKEMN